eukprot:g76868.t1
MLASARLLRKAGILLPSSCILLNVRVERRLSTGKVVGALGAGLDPWLSPLTAPVFDGVVLSVWRWVFAIPVWGLVSEGGVTFGVPGFAAWLGSPLSS